jgi:class 3 adenylate cyclase
VADEPGLTAPASAGPSAPRRRRGLGIQSKLLMMLLGVSIVSTLVVGVLGYRTGTQALEESAFDRLTQVRESRAREAAVLFEELSHASVLYTRGATNVGAARDFAAGFRALQDTPATPEQVAALEGYYEDVFVPTLEARTGQESDPDVFVPTSAAQRRLQSAYTVPSGGDYDEAIAVDDAGDGSAWSAAHARYHDFFREMVQRFGYEDALIIDPEGNVVYSAYKGVDLGTNVRTGPYRNTNLASSFEVAIGSNTIDSAYLDDFGRYQPSLGVPTAWLTSPIGEGGAVDGVLALEVPIEALNELMTGDRGWAAEGLGDSGETYLVGPDHLMRSVSRPLLEHPEEFRADVVAAGTPPDVADRQVAVAGSTLLQEVNSESVERALRGETGTMIETDYQGHEVLTAYAPLEVGGLRWVILAQIDAAEAFEPVTEFARVLALSTAVIILVVALLSLALSQVFTRPLRRLVTAVRGVAAGDLGHQVPVTSRDEFGDLAAAFNEMSHSLQVKDALMEQHRLESERLLHSLMPASVAKRYRGGEETIADDHQDVAVIYGELVGFDELSRTMGSEASLALLNGLVRSVDDAADRYGVERVRTMRDGYLASCGLVVPRVDGVRRMVDFALEAQQVVARFNALHGAELSVRAGIDTGAVSSGLVGRGTVVYDLWGEAVDLAHAVGALEGEPGVHLSQRAHDELGDARASVQVGTVDTGDGPELVWRLVP